MDPSLILGAAAVVTVWVMLSLLGSERQRQVQIKQVEAAIRAASQPAPTEAPPVTQDASPKSRTGAR